MPKEKQRKNKFDRCRSPLRTANLQRLKNLRQYFKVRRTSEYHSVYKVKWRKLSVGEDLAGDGGRLRLSVEIPRETPNGDGRGAKFGQRSFSNLEITMNIEQNENLRGENRSDFLLYTGWIIALTATVGSLFFSEVMSLPPCVLCWYQRIAMYPLVLIIGIGIITGDRRMKNYAVPICLIGLAISIYHNLLYYGILPESVAPCTEGISCTSRQIEWLGFITIPLLALAAFLSLALCLLFYKQEKL